MCAQSVVDPGAGMGQLSGEMYLLSSTAMASTNVVEM